MIAWSRTRRRAGLDPLLGRLERCCPVLDRARAGRRFFCARRSWGDPRAGLARSALADSGAFFCCGASIDAHGPKRVCLRGAPAVHEARLPNAEWGRVCRAGPVGIEIPARNLRQKAWLFRRFRCPCPFSLVCGSRFRTPPLSSRTVASRESGWRP